MSSDKLNILQVITPRRFYGAERMLVYLCEGLRDRGHQVTVACKPQPDLQEELGKVGIPTLPMRISGKVNGIAALRLAHLAHRLSIDVIHTHLSSAALWGSVAGRMMHIPVVAEVHALNSRTCFMLADHIVTCSEGVRRHLADQDVPLKRMDVLYNGLPDRLFEGLPSKAEVRRQLDLPADAPVIGVVAHLAPRKGHRYLLEALALLRPRFPGLVCLLVGEGEIHLELDELAEQLGVREAVRFLGFRSDAVQLMQAMDTVVLPSVAKEGLGVALIEASFLGKPVIGSDCAGIDEVIEHGQTGLLVPPGDSWGLAEALTAVLADPVMAQQLGANALLRAQRHFSLDVMAARAEEIYRVLLAHH